MKPTLTKSSGALAAGYAFGTPVTGLRHLHVINTHTADLYLQVHNSLAAPSEGAAPLWVAPVFAGLRLSETWGDGDLNLANCYVCLSTTLATKTLAGTVGYFTITCAR